MEYYSTFLNAFEGVVIGFVVVVVLATIRLYLKK